MKRLLFATIGCGYVLLLSCNHLQAHMDSVNSNGDSTAKSAAETNRANTTAVYKGIQAGDVSVMDRFVATDAVDHSDMGDVKGLDAIKKELNDMHNHIDNMKFDVLADATDGDYHFTLIKLSGTTKDNWMGMPAGTKIDNTSVGVEKVSNGKITEHWRYADAQEMMKMMPPKK